MKIKKIISAVLIFSMLMPFYNTYGSVVDYSQLKSAEKTEAVNAVNTLSDVSNGDIAGIGRVVDKELNAGNDEVVITPAKDSENTFTCDVTLPPNSTYVTISATGAGFVLPIAASSWWWSSDKDLADYGLEFSYGIDTKNDSLIEEHSKTANYGILTFNITDVTKAAEGISKVIYTMTDKKASVKISTTTIDIDKDTDVFFGHIYQMKTEKESSWPQAVVDAHNTVKYADSEKLGEAESGYLVTITSANENKMLLKMIKNTNGYTKTWLGGTSNYKDSSHTQMMDYDYIKANVDAGIDQAEYFTYDTMKKSAPEGHNPLKGEDFYWIDGPERGKKLPDGGDFWCDANHNDWKQDEPNNGHVVWAGYGGPYWDDINLNQVNKDEPVVYVVEFGGKTADEYSTESTPISDAEAYTEIIIEKYDVSFNDNKTNPNVTTERVFPGESVNVPADPSREDCAFKGWTYTKNGSDFLTAKTFAPDRDVTFYAKWEPLIAFEAVADSGVYDENTENPSRENADNGAVSFNFRVTDSDGNADVDLSNFTKFYMVLNDSLTADTSSMPEDFSNVQPEDKAGLWFHCIIDSIPQSAFGEVFTAVPYGSTKTGEIIEGSAISKSVDSSKWIAKDWQ